MAFVVETGEGLSNSNAFISVEFAKAYWDDRGRDYTDYNDEQIQEAIVRATMFISEAHRWKGYRKKPRNATTGFQALEFPRQDLFDYDGYWVDDDSIPREIQWATAEVTFQELIDPFSLVSPVYDYHSRVKSEKIGPIAIEYDVTYKTAESARPVVLLVRDLIGQFLLSSFANPLSGRAVRG